VNLWLETARAHRDQRAARTRWSIPKSAKIDAYFAITKNYESRGQGRGTIAKDPSLSFRMHQRTTEVTVLPKALLPRP
jgi:hypothetical protein